MKLAPAIALAAMTAIWLYSLIVRFANPELTETQIFLKMIGIN